MSKASLYKKTKIAVGTPSTLDRGQELKNEKRLFPKLDLGQDLQ